MSELEITEAFIVHKPVESVWTLFCDVPELARCLPGAELTSDNGDGTYDGQVNVKLGPISSSFEGTANVVFDHGNRTATIDGRGVDRSGGSHGRVEVGVQLAGVEGSTTEVNIRAKVMLAGPIAQFGRTGLVNEISRRLIDDFSTCLHAKLDAEDESTASAVEAPEVRGLSLALKAIWGALWSWVKRFLSRGAT